MELIVLQQFTCLSVLTSFKLTFQYLTVFFTEVQYENICNHFASVTISLIFTSVGPSSTYFWLQCPLW
jgi:hypothetical protein